MNERDYLIAEAVTLAMGAAHAVTFISVLFATNTPFSLGAVMIMLTAIFGTFFFGLFFHMRRRIWIAENKEMIKRHMEE